MKYTQNYNLRKPEDTDPADIRDLNHNADEIDGKLKEIENWESAHLQASNPHSITPALIGAETPQGAQQKANQAETNAKSYADQVASDLSQKLNETRIKVLDVEQDVSNISKVLTNLNPNQEAKQSVSGYGILSLPKNAANGQVSSTVKGNTETDEEGNTKSTVGAMRLKSVGKNKFDKKQKPTDRFGVTETILDTGIKVKSNVAGTYQAVKYVLQLEPLQSYTIKADILVITGGSRIVVGNYTANTNIGYFSTEGKYSFTTPSDGKIHLIFYSTLGASALGEVDYTNIQLEKGTTATEYEPYKESIAYINGAGELRSLPNGTYDEVRLSEGKLIKRIGKKTNVASGAVINYADMADNGTYYAWNDDGETETGVKGDTLGIDATELIYQLAQPIETNVPAQMLTAGPQHTFMWLPEVADAGIYGDDGIAILREELPIKELKKLSKIDFYTGEEILLNLSAAIIAEDKKSFTHPDLTKGDIVFFVYEYPSELSTVPEMEVEYYDSRYVVQDTENGKMYTWKIVSTNGVASIQLTEVV